MCVTVRLLYYLTYLLACATIRPLITRSFMYSAARMSVPRPRGDRDASVRSASMEVGEGTPGAVESSHLKVTTFVDGGSVGCAAGAHEEPSLVRSLASSLV